MLGGGPGLCHLRCVTFGGMQGPFCLAAPGAGGRSPCWCWAQGSSRVAEICSRTPI
jgi:hypothetical protein